MYAIKSRGRYFLGIWRIGSVAQIDWRVLSTARLFKIKAEATRTVRQLKKYTSQKMTIVKVKVIEA